MPIHRAGGLTRPASGLEDVSGAQLVNCGESLVWSGLSSQLSETGNDYATTFVFFRKLGTHHMRLERVGMQVLPANEGSCTALWHNQSEDRLLTLWAIPDAGKDRHGLRFGSMEDWISGQFQETRIVGLGAFAFEQGALSADGRFLGLVSRSGEIFCVRLSDSRVVATLAGSVPFSAVAPGAAGSTFWLADGQSQLYSCSLIGGSA